MDYNQLKAPGSYCRVAGPRVWARTIVLQDRARRARTVALQNRARLGSYRRATGPHERRSLLCQFVVSRFVERGLYACC